MVQGSRFSFFNEAHIWYSKDPEQYPVSDQFENVLSDKFYKEIVAHPIPADLEAVKVICVNRLLQSLTATKITLAATRLPSRI